MRWGYEDIPALQEGEVVMGRGYESVGSSENLVWPLGGGEGEWEKKRGATGRRK